MIQAGKLSFYPSPAVNIHIIAKILQENLRGVFLCCEKAIRLKIKLDRVTEEAITGYLLSNLKIKLLETECFRRICLLCRETFFFF